MTAFPGTTQTRVTSQSANRRWCRALTLGLSPSSTNSTRVDTIARLHVRPPHTSDRSHSVLLLRWTLVSSYATPPHHAGRLLHFELICRLFDASLNFFISAGW